jgi:hypothetical protein
VALLSAPLQLHDVADAESLARRALEDRLKTWGAHLEPCDYEDALSFLVGLAWELADKYDPAFGQSFSTFCYRRLRLRLVDWYRSRFGDARYGEQPTVAISDEERHEVAAAFDFSWPEVLSLINSVQVAPTTRQVLQRVVIPLMESGQLRDKRRLSVADIVAFNGMEKNRARQILNDLRRDLECRLLQAA